MAEEKKQDKKENKALEIALAAIHKDQGKGAIFYGNSGKIPDVECIPSGSPKIDEAIGGGWGRGRIVEIYGPESSGKAQPLDAKILTPQGWSYMEELTMGDTICAPDGSNTTVIGIYPQGKKKVYKITFDDKTSTRCTEEHLWLVYTRHSDIGEILSTRDLIEKGLSNKNGARKFRIPTIQPLKFQGEKELPIDPYLLGLLLGDESFRGPTVKFSTKDFELLNNVKAILDKDFPEMSISEKHGDCDYSLRNKTRNHEKTRLYNALEQLELIGKLSQHKSIPRQYLFSSISQRTRLLQGLMDSDGSVGTTGSISFSTSSPTLSKNFEFLARSLGFRCTTSSRITKYTSSTGNKVDGLPSFRSSILVNSSPIKPVTLSRRAKRLTSIPSDYRHRFIESIEFIDESECQCIKVGHPDELYITDDFIVTHNTTLALHAIAEAQKLGGVCAFIDAEHAADMNYARALQVNTDDLLISQPDSGEQALDIAESLIRSGALDLIVIDSVAALVPRAELEGDMGAPQMGLQARLMSQAMRKIDGIAHKTNTTVMFINQIRMKIGVMFGSPETCVSPDTMVTWRQQSK